MQKKTYETKDGAGGADDGGHGGQAARYNGSYHCDYHKRKRKFDVCGNMEEIS